MKKICLIIFCLVNSISLYSQDTNDLGKILLNVYTPDNIPDLSTSETAKLDTKIKQILTCNDIGYSFSLNSFVIYPVFEIYDVKQVEGGMKNLVIVTADITLFVKQIVNDNVISSISTTLKGSGLSKKEAITNLLSNINTKDTKYKDFINESKNRILQLYANYCPVFISKSEELRSKQQYADALYLLATVPEELPCYTEIKKKMLDIYKLYQDIECKQQIQKAKSHIAIFQYVEAADILANIDPYSQCHKDAETLISQLKDKLELKEKQALDITLEGYRSSVDLEKRRIDAVKEVAKSYYSSNANKTVNHYNIMR
ncbi:MAG: hypothetical protein LBC68_12900 [Prevotellaceae bacterium]|jgi:hypothetical protein|nr:hypothetical protein [Prevotellaceae bacterium]